MDIQTLQATVRDFAAVRNWPRFHTPKNLAMALVVEAAELLEIFQWLTPEESAQAASDAPRKQHIGEEIADVLIYLLQLADHTRVDVAAAVRDKLQRNARKYPVPAGATDVSLPATAAATDTEAVTHVLLDYENVQPSEDQVRALVPQASTLWVFHGPHQRQVAERFASFGHGLAIVPISRSGKNALDFHLSFYMGYIAARHPRARFVVLANDKGYEPMLEHARQLNFDVQAIGLPRVRKATAVSPAARQAAPKPVVKKSAARPAIAPAARPTTAPAARPTTAPAARPAAKPAAKPTGKSTSKSTSKPTSKPTTGPDVRPGARPTSKAAARTSAKAAPRAVPKPAPMAIPPTAPVGAAVAAPKPPVKAAAKKAASPPGALSVRQLAQGLHKLGAKRPTRLARLRGVLKSLLGTAASPDAIDAALSRLQAARVVAVDAGGQVSYPGSA